MRGSFDSLGFSQQCGNIRKTGQIRKAGQIPPDGTDSQGRTDSAGRDRSAPTATVLSRSKCLTRSLAPYSVSQVKQAQINQQAGIASPLHNRQINLLDNTFCIHMQRQRRRAVPHRTHIQKRQSSAVAAVLTKKSHVILGLVRDQ